VGGAPDTVCTHGRNLCHPQTLQQCQSDANHNGAAHKSKWLLLGILLLCAEQSHIQQTFAPTQQLLKLQE